MSVSVVIPSMNERYLARTVDRIYKKFTGDFEVIIVQDGHSDFPVPFDDGYAYPNLTVIYKIEPVGVRQAINEAVDASHGDYILKTDAHCEFDNGFNAVLERDCYGDDWVMVARRWTLDVEKWERRPRIVDYYYLSCPWTYKRPLMMQSCPWITRTGQRGNTKIDDLMCFQGSMWFMSRKHWDWLGGLEVGVEQYAEHHEISMKTWMGGGRVVINKNTWYAHPRYIERGYRMSLRQVWRDHDHSAHFWTENKWEQRVHDFDWLIDKFWPLPTEHNKHKTEKYYWPEDWRERFYDRAVPAG